MDLQTILTTNETRMQKAMEALQHHLASIRTGRANPQILEHIQVDYYGSPTPINQMAAVSVVEGRQLMIKPYDRSIIKNIETAISTSDLTYPVLNDGNVLRINIPSLTEEDRKVLAKDAHKVGEESKVAVRNIRRDANEEIKKDKEANEDVKKDAQERVQKLTDKYIKKVDEIVKEKTTEIMSI